MPIAYTVQDPFHWDSHTKSTMNEASRRNSLLSALSVFEFSMLPGIHHRSETEDVDPFAPISIDDGFSHAKPQPTKQQQSQFHRGSFDRVLTDRSESSGGSAPSLTSSGTGSHATTQLNPHPSAHMFSFEEHSGTYQENFDDTPFEAFSSPAPLAPSVLSASFSSTSDDNSILGGDEGDDASDSQRFKRFHEEKWSHRYKELLVFHREFGHSAVPHTFPRNPQLARWVKRQRRQYKLRRDARPSTMTLERLQLLDSVGFVWDSHDVNWREKLMALDTFRSEHGHCNVPSNYTDKKLATWVKCQRRQYKLHVDRKPSAMTEQRIRELENRGFEWEIRSAGGKTKVSSPDFAPTSY